MRGTGFRPSSYDSPPESRPNSHRIDNPTGRRGGQSGPRAPSTEQHAGAHAQNLSQQQRGLANRFPWADEPPDRDPGATPSGESFATNSEENREAVHFALNSLNIPSHSSDEEFEDLPLATAPPGAPATTRDAGGTRLDEPAVNFVSSNDVVRNVPAFRQQLWNDLTSGRISQEKYGNKDWAAQEIIGSAQRSDFTLESRSQNEIGGFATLMRGINSRNEIDRLKIDFIVSRLPGNGGHLVENAAAMSKELNLGGDLHVFNFDQESMEFWERCGFDTTNAPNLTLTMAGNEKWTEIGGVLRLKYLYDRHGAS